MGKISKALEKSSDEYQAELEGGQGGNIPDRPEPTEQRSQPAEQKQETVEPVRQQPVLPETSGYGRWDERLAKVTGFSSALSESFRILRSRIVHMSDQEDQKKTILVTSAAPAEGKSFVAANLAIALAQGMDQYCLLVDCDLRRPCLAELLGLQDQPGISDYLQGKQSVEQTIKKTPVEKLSLLASGAPPPNPSELVASLRMQGLVQELSSRYTDRFIIFDSPPMRVASETAVLARQVDGVVLVVRWGSSGREHVKKAIEEIGRERIVGIVFNGYRANIVEKKLIKYSNYHRYEYASKYSQPEK